METVVVKSGAVTVHCYHKGEKEIEVRLDNAEGLSGCGLSTSAALEDLRSKSPAARSILNNTQTTFQTPIRFGVNRRRPGSRSPRNIEHKNGHCFIMAAPDDPDFHNMVRHAARSKFNGWSLTGYFVMQATRDEQE